MKKFLIIFALALAGCKTCETEVKIAEGFTKYVVTALQCSNASNVKADMAGPHLFILTVLGMK